MGGSITKTPRHGARKEYVVGRHSFAKISVVESIRLSEAMKADFQEFERQGLSAEERRKTIGKKYGKVR